MFVFQAVTEVTALLSGQIMNHYTLVIHQINVAAKLNISVISTCVL